MIDEFFTNNVIFLSSVSVIGSLSTTGSLEVGSGSSTLYVDNQVVGVNTETPNEELTVVGNISATGQLYADGYNKNRWDNSSTSTETLSSNWNSVYTDVVNTSGNWDSVYTDVVNTSGNWDSVYTEVSPVSSNWDSVYTDVVNTSGNWNSVYTDVSNTSGNWDSVYTDVVNTSGNWNSVYSTYNTNSSTHSTYEYVQSGFLPLSGGIVTGKIRFNDDITIFGDLSCSGTQTFANTVFSTTSSVSVVHIGSGPALYVGNDGNGDIASFYDIDQNIEILHVGGINSLNPNVGVYVSNPNKNFTVKGEISSSGDIWTSGNFLSGGIDILDILKPSNNDSSYTTVNTNSSTTWNYQGTDIKDLSSGWVGGNTAYTNLVSNSAGYLSSVDLSFLSVSGNWDSVYSSVNSNSANYILNGGNAKGSDLLIGTSDSFNLNLETNNSTKVTITSSGKVGIGTTDPSSNLHIAYTTGIPASSLVTSDALVITSQSTAPGLSIISSGNSATHRGVFKCVRSRGTLESPTAPLLNDSTFALIGTIFDGISSNQATALIEMKVDGNVSDQIAPQRISFITSQTNSSARTERMTIKSDGNVGIGTTTPNQNLTVVGNISATGNIYADTTILENATIQTFVNPATATGNFLILNINGSNRAIRLWDFTN